ncbi:DUF2807 domain-containing protein [Candidatus Poribacteria bacterium]|jgi:hypothetical protein|nr:DUF2807 domain-containing protein [Candidatus Poribacteria bacterium]MBT5531930.1 DUF2807 domain-containing protein [Candidatus Poribacteria bacterium]MBT7098871.1 DUF2807 domain-containing protein [Candidatus Poribacteria bacterium]MBT7804523.1 DUF2807 domain-containing protein [Candidatus Poribacteria bacterium]
MSHRLNVLLLPLIIGAIGCVETLDDGDAIRGSGEMVTVHEDRKDFDEIEIGSAFRATITRGDAYAVSIRVDLNVLDHVRVSRIGGTLSITLDDDHFYRDVTLEADITAPALQRLALSGASSASLVGFHSDDDIEVDLSGASSAAGDLSAGDVDCELSGASTATLTGSAGDLSLHGSGASTADLGGLVNGDGDIDLSGASSATVQATGTIDATLSGASLLEYVGSPTLGDISVSSGSTLRQAD